jgi:Na+-driven multidrug efflux pump
MWKTFAAFLGPMLLGNILQSLSGTINNIYIGQMIGVGALAAVTSFFPIMFFFIAFTIGLGAGASVLIGQAWGARDTGKVKAVAGTTLAVGASFGLLVPSSAAPSPHRCSRPWARRPTSWPMPRSTPASC